MGSPEWHRQRGTVEEVAPSTRETDRERVRGWDKVEEKRLLTLKTMVGSRKPRDGLVRSYSL
jgi:hypothetical protein